MPEETTTPEGTDTPTQDSPERTTFADILAERDAPQEESTERTEADLEADVQDDDEEEPEPDGEKPEDGDGDESENDEDEEGESDETPGAEKVQTETDAVESAKKVLSEAGIEGIEIVEKAEYQAVADTARAVYDVFESQEQAQSELPGFLRGLAEHHGLSIAELLGEELLAEIEEPPFANEMERKLWTELQSLKREKQADKQQRDKQAAKEKSDAQFAAHVKTITPGVVTAMSKRYDGFTPTAEQIAEALREYPQYRDRPTRAVEAHLARQLFKHGQRLRKKDAPKDAHDLDRSRDVGGTALPDDPTKIKAHHILAMR